VCICVHKGDCLYVYECIYLYCVLKTQQIHKKAVSSSDATKRLLRYNTAQLPPPGAKLVEKSVRVDFIVGKDITPNDITGDLVTYVFTDLAHWHFSLCCQFVCLIITSECAVYQIR
jgi:hypothetical protein